MTLTIDQLHGVLGQGGNVVGPGGKIGGIGQVYLDDTSGEPEWVTTTTGLFGASESFVPLQGAKLSGNDITVTFDKATVKDAPRVDADGSLTPADEERLYAHYGLSDSYTSTHGQRTDTTPAAGTTTKNTGTATTDDAMTRSEEQLKVGVQSREAGRVKLRKYVTTEQVTQTVPVRHEEARITREPITEANYDKSVDGPEITEAVHEVVLHAEQPVVAKETVPVERIKLGTETVTEQVTVNEQVRKEQIELDDDTTTGTSTPRR